MTGQSVTISATLYQDIRQLLLAARTQVRQTVNSTMVQTNWRIGQKIVEDEQGGQKRAAYGKQVLPELARRLGEEFGPGFDVSNLRNMRQFYQCLPIRDEVRRELSWTHYRALIRIDNPQARDWYATEAAEQGWCVRVFDQHHRQKGDNPTLGLIFCSERNAAVAKYSLLADKPQLFASKYQALMPTEAELQAELERDRALLEQNQP